MSQNSFVDFLCINDIDYFAYRFSVFQCDIKNLGIVRKDPRCPLGNKAVRNVSSGLVYDVYIADDRNTPGDVLCCAVQCIDIVIQDSITKPFFQAFMNIDYGFRRIGAVNIFVVKILYGCAHCPCENSKNNKQSKKPVFE